MSLRNRIEDLIGKFTPEKYINKDPKVNIIDETEVDGLILTKLVYEVDESEQISAYVLKPKLSHSKMPGILALHQTTKNKETGAKETVGLEGDESYFYALELAKRGYTVMSPDYPFFGDYSTTIHKIYNEFGYQSVTMKALINHVVALNILQSFDEVDDNKLGCIGHSLGGTNTLFLTYFDTRIKCAVVSAGFTTFQRYESTAITQDLTKWAQKDKYMPMIETKFKKRAANVPFDFPELLAALNPTPLFLNVPKKDEVFDFSGAINCVEFAEKEYKKNFANNNFTYRTPDCYHDFPENIRIESYCFLDEHLKN